MQGARSHRGASIAVCGEPAVGSKPLPGRIRPRGSVPIMIRCPISTAGKPICGFWTCNQCRPCPRCRDHIHLSNGSSPQSARSIWIVCAFGLQVTWNESWSCSRITTTQLACTRGYPTTRLRRKRAAQPLSQPALGITVGKAIATDCLNCQSPLEWQFAMYRLIT